MHLWVSQVLEWREISQMNNPLFFSLCWCRSTLVLTVTSIPLINNQFFNNYKLCCRKGKSVLYDLSDMSIDGEMLAKCRPLVGQQSANSQRSPLVTKYTFTVGRSHWTGPLSGKLMLCSLMFLGFSEGWYFSEHVPDRSLLYGNSRGGQLWVSTEFPSLYCPPVSSCN